MNGWLTPLVEFAAGGEKCVLLNVVATAGSTPREAGAKMLVTEFRTYDTVGGGQLEYQCIKRARNMLDSGRVFESARFALGPGLGQCCGGSATVCFELVHPQSTWVTALFELRSNQRSHVLASLVSGPLGADGQIQKLVVTGEDCFGGTGHAALDDLIVRACRRTLKPGGQIVSETFSAAHTQATVLLEPIHPPGLNIELYGAGHVGRALVHVLGALPCTVKWIDSRKDVFPPDIPANVVCVTAPLPEYEVSEALSGACFLVMTHSHALDQQICERILSRNDFRYCGLIGSRSKRRKFEKRFRASGVPEHTMARLTCPIGIAGLTGKHPAQIAVSVAAQLLQIDESTMSHDHPMTGVPLLRVDMGAT